jgi:hypothetical protein
MDRVGERDAKGVTFAENDIRAEFAGRGEHAQRSRVDSDSYQRASVVGGFDERLVVNHAPKKSGYAP